MGSAGFGPGLNDTLLGSCFRNRGAVFGDPGDLFAFKTAEENLLLTVREDPRCVIVIVTLNRPD